MTLLRDLYATIVIFISNFTARWGTWVNVLLLTALAALILVMLVRAMLAGHTFRRPAPVAPPTPDERLTEHAAQSLSSAIRFATVTGDQAAMDGLVEYLKERYADAFAKMNVLALPEGSLLLRWRAADRKAAQAPVMFCGHLDVVPPGEGWTGEPFSGAREDGLIRGRGAVDCKGPVIAMLEAVSSLMEEGYAPRRDLYFAFGHDEETGGTGGAAVLAELLQKRGVYFDMILDEGGTIRKSHLGRRSYPAARIGGAEKAVCVYKLTARVPAAQLGEPPRHTAVGALSEAVCRIEAALPRLRLLDPVKQALRASMPAMGFWRRLVVANLPLTKPLLGLCFRGHAPTMALLRTTLSATQMSGSGSEVQLPTVAEATVTGCLLQGDTAQSVLRHIRDLVADLPVEVELGSVQSDPSHISSDKSPYYEALCNAVHERFATLPCIPTILTGSTDARYYEPLSGTVIRFTPILTSDQAYNAVHGPDEYVRETSLGAAVEIYRSFMKKL